MRFEVSQPCQICHEFFHDVDLRSHECGLFLCPACVKFGAFNLIKAKLKEFKLGEKPNKKSKLERVAYKSYRREVRNRLRNIRSIKKRKKLLAL